MLPCFFLFSQHKRFHLYATFRQNNISCHHRNFVLRQIPNYTTDTLPLLTFKKIRREMTVLTVRIEASAAAVPKLFLTTSV